MDPEYKQDDTQPKGATPDPPLQDDHLDADGTELDYAALSGGW